MNEDTSVLTRKAPLPDQVMFYGEHSDQSADIWIGKSDTPHPLLILVHGGFWRPQYGRDQIGPMAASLAEAGWTVAAIGYRRIPGEPDVSVTDVRHSIQILSQEIHAHNGEVILIGHSAGGHLALLAGSDNTLTISAVLALAPAADLRLAEDLDLGNGAVGAFLGGAAASRPDLDPTHLKSMLAPIYILHGQDDQIVPIQISVSFLKAHPNAILKSLPNTGHFALIDPLSQAWLRIVDCLHHCIQHVR